MNPIQLFVKSYERLRICNIFVLFFHRSSTYLIIINKFSGLNKLLKRWISILLIVSSSLSADDILNFNVDKGLEFLEKVPNDVGQAWCSTLCSHKKPGHEDMLDTKYLIT